MASTVILAAAVLVAQAVLVIGALVILGTIVCGLADGVPSGFVRPNPN